MIKIIKDDVHIRKECVYRVQIGQQLICKFDHNKLDGLAVCLRQAADSLEQSEWADFVLLSEQQGG